MKRINKGPLRKVVGWDGEYEVLECGHKQRPVQDLAGPTNACRRRCKKCQHCAMNTQDSVNRRI